MADENKPVEQKRGKPTAYRATEKVYVDGVVYYEGDVFVTDILPKGNAWEPVDAAEKAAADASESDPNRKPDVDLNALNTTELKAVAAARGINVGTATSKADLIAVISAEDIPQK